MPRGVHCTCDRSSKEMAYAKLAMPAKVTCHAVPLKGSTSGDCQRFESTEPSAQLNDPPSRLSDHQNSVAPMVRMLINLGHNKTAMPAIPSASPPNPRMEM